MTAFAGTDAALKLDHFSRIDDVYIPNGKAEHDRREHDK
jgi:hypothetical protein